MRSRPLASVIAAVLGLSVSAAAASGGGPEVSGGGAAAARGAVSAAGATTPPHGPRPPKEERTHPHARPLRGLPSTAFYVLFRLRKTPGHQGVLATDYRVEVSKPPGSSATCGSPQPAPLESGTAGELARVDLRSPAGGWCVGRYHVTVFLDRGPYCPPPVEGESPMPCPAFPTLALATGEAHFVVSPSCPPPAGERQSARRDVRPRFQCPSPCPPGPIPAASRSHVLRASGPSGRSRSIVCPLD